MLRLLIQQTKNYARQPVRHYARFRRNQLNAGIRRQVLAETNETEFETHWDDDLSKYEGDLTNASAVYDQHRQESVEQRENLRRNIVRNKYFSDRTPSFLTWAEMEQIRRFNANDPEEWNEYKLAESFPADAVTIRKVLKAKWEPKDSKRIAKYDAKARSNWEAFGNGEFKEMDQRLAEHLKKFSKRNLTTKVSEDSILKKEMPKPPSTQFVGIISSCKKYAAETKPKRIPSESDDSVAVLPKLSAQEYVTAKSISSRKLYTFKPTPANESVSTSTGTQTIFNNPFGTGVVPHTDSNTQNSTLSVTKFENNEVQLRESDLKTMSVPSIRQHIRIPVKLFRKGATYRLADCYYDIDGELLYRVPGMTKS